MSGWRKIRLCGRILLVLLEAFSLLATAGLLDGRWQLDVFEMYTTLSNCLYALYLLCEVVWMWAEKGRARERTAFCPVLKGMAVMGLTVTMLTVIFVLRSGVRFDSFAGASLLGLHFVIPFLALADWLLDEPGRIRPFYPFIWAGAPLVYACWALLAPLCGSGRGLGAAYAHGSRYPYPFLDVEALGAGRVALNCLEISAVFFLLSYAFVLLDHLRAQKGGWSAGKI